jgi:hypothetical protein
MPQFGRHHKVLTSQSIVITSIVILSEAKDLLFFPHIRTVTSLPFQSATLPPLIVAASKRLACAQDSEKQP